MANWDILKSAIAGIIKTNGNQEITGQLLQNVLNNIVSSVGENATFAGIATPTTNPGAPDGPAFYLAAEAGTYANFSGIEIAEGEAAILQWNNAAWSKKTSGLATQQQLTELEAIKVVISPGKNLYNNASRKTGKFFSSSTGTIAASSDYSISDYIPVTPGTGLHISGDNDAVVAGNAFLIWYNSSLNYLSGSLMLNTKQFTVPEGAAFMRFSIQYSVKNVQVEIGTSRTTYEPYQPIYGYINDILQDYTKNNLLNIGLSQRVYSIAGKNLYNPYDCKIGYFLSGYGEEFVNNNYRITNYIKVVPGQNIHASESNGKAIGTITTYVWFYSENGDKIIGYTTDKTDYTVPSGASYMRFTVLADKDNIQIEVGTERTSYESYNPLSNYPVVEDTRFNAEILKKVDISVGKNLYDERLRTDGLYFNTATGTTGINQNYAISGFIPVTPGDNIHISATNDVQVGDGYLNWYDQNLSHLSGEAMAKQFTVPSGASYMRFSLQIFATNVQVEIGTTRTVYEPYNPIAGYLLIIPDETITMPKLSNELQTLITSNSGERFNSCRISGTIAPNEILRTMERYHILKNILLSAKINGSISKVIVGVGGVSNFRDYFAYWVEIDATNVKLYWYNNINDVLLGTYVHGLTLTSTTIVEILTQQEGNTNSVTLRIFDDAGNIFTQSLPAWGVGSAFVQNANASGSLDVELSFVPRDITKKIWLFGDSYISFIAKERWPYYLAEQGLTNFFVNSQPGLQPDNAYLDLQSLLTLGHIPSFLVWTLGMNGATTESQSGGQWIINPAQKTVIENVVTLCTNAGIRLILATIPTVPERQKTGFSSYIRSLGLRYIDFAAAVKCNDAGQWTAGLLSADNVHPSALGAKVLASQVLIDFPELGIID